MIDLNHIYCENCTDTMSRMDSQSVDVILTSPPYNMSKRKGGISDSGRYDVYKDWLTYEDYSNFTVGLFKDFDRIIKPNGVVLYNFSYSIENPSLPYQLVSDIVTKTEWMVADTIVWVKKNGMPFPANPRRLSRIWEFVWVFCRKSECNSYTTNHLVSKVSPNGQTYYKPIYNLIKADNNDCPTPKLNQATFSTNFVTQLLTMYARKGMVIYDPFMGTGTTAVACKRYGVDYIGSELSSDQCIYAENRLAEEMKK